MLDCAHEVGTSLRDATRPGLWDSVDLLQEEGGGVNDGARTRDNQNHNLGLYQLSYVHHRAKILACLRSVCPFTAVS